LREKGKCELLIFGEGGRNLSSLFMIDLEKGRKEAEVPLLSCNTVH